MSLPALQAIRSRVHHILWDPPPAPRPRWQQELVDLARLAVAVGHDLASGALTLRAMGLVFTTLLALVPLIAVSFSVLKGFGVHNQIEPALQQLLMPLGERADEITGRLVEFVDNVEVGVLGALGVAFLLYTAVSMVQKVEESFNFTWNVGKRRTLARRFSDYTSVLLIGPFLVFLALGLIGTLTSTQVAEAIVSVEPFGTLFGWLARLVPYLLLIAAFSFIYVLIPNTRVRAGPALFGAVIAGVAWDTVGRLFAQFVVTSTNYQAVYSGFAILLLLLIWLYLSWLILLIGSSIAFYRQYPEYLRTGGRDGSRMSPAQAERLTLAIAFTVARAWYRGDPAPDHDSLARSLGMPIQPIDQALQVLTRAGLVTAAGGSPERYVPGRPPERTTVKAVLDAARHTERKPHLFANAGPGPDGEVMVTLDQALEQALGETTIADMVLREKAGTAA